MESRRQHGALATVFGGSGFAGRHSVRALARQGWRVRAAVRRPDLAGHLQPMGVVGQIHAVQANVRYPASVAAALQGSDVVVNMVGILTRSGAQTFDAVHVDGARAIAKAAREAGVKRLVHLSAIGADPSAKSNYARSKGLGEQAVLEEFPDAIILRPSVVFGPEDEFYNRFASMAQLSPALPLIGGGKTQFQPVFVGDLAVAVEAACAGRGTPGTIYELGGPEIQTFRQILDKVQQWTGRSRGYINVPFWLAKLHALSTWPLPNCIRPLTLDQVRMLQSDNIVSDAAKAESRTLQGLGVDHPQAAGVIVPDYLERFKPHGQFSHYRS